MNALKTVTRRLPLNTSFKCITTTTIPIASRYTTSPILRTHFNSHRPNSTMATPTKLSADAFLETVKARRSIYALSKDLSAASPARIQEIVETALLHVPSSFNSQSNRVIVLFGADHDRFWDMVTSTLRKHVTDDEKWKSTSGRMAMFQGAAGSILMFEDQAVVQKMQAQYATYAEYFPTWSIQSLGMLQHTLWTALEAEGLGVNIQHYNPIVDDQVAEAWKVPSTWKLNAQLVFGGKAGEPNEKTFMPLEERLKVFGA